MTDEVVFPVMNLVRYKREPLSLYVEMEVMGEVFVVLVVFYHVREVLFELL